MRTIMGALCKACLTWKLENAFKNFGLPNIPYSVKILVNAEIPFLSKESV